MSDWQDRIVDAGLFELHGQRPPDLLAGVLQRLQQPAASAEVAPAPAALPLWRLLAGALAAVAAVAVIALVRRGVADLRPQAAAVVEVAVLRGTVECTEFSAPPPRVDTGAVRRVPAGSRHEFAAVVGNRLRSGDQDLAMEVAPFGVLTTTAHTDMEVRSMEWTVKNGVVAAGALTFAVVAGTVTWHALARTEQVDAGHLLRLEAKADGAAAAQVLADNQRLRDENNQLKQQVEQLMTQMARREQPPATLPSALVAETKAPAAVAVAFDDPAFAEMLRNIDWSAVGTATDELGPKLVELARALDKEGGKLPIELALAVQKLNQKLIDQLPALMKADLPGFGPNGVFTHPLVVANSLAAALQAGGQSLSESQLATIAGLVKFASADAAAINAVNHDFDLEGLAAETAMKERMYQQLSDQLTPEQRALVFPDGAGTNDGTSLFSTGLMWQTASESVPASNAAEFARAASHRLESQLGLDAATAAQVQQVLERAAGGAPELWANPATPVELSQGHFLRTGRASSALRLQLQWMREIASSVSLTQEQRARLNSYRRVLVPLPR